jgi:site-specific DNA-methyltransferase (adenine-specific)
MSPSNQKMNWKNPFLKGLVKNEIHSFDELAVILNADCFRWLEGIPDNSIHAVVTDPPYGVKEFDHDQINKLEIGKGGIWRLPPAFDGNTRSPLPRFTALNKKEMERVKSFFEEFSLLIQKKMVPGAHMFLASNSFLSLNVFNSISNGGLEFRGEIIRLVRTMRGGDKPKNFEGEFPEVVSLPRGCYEPWGIFRKPLEKGLTLGENLRHFGTGGLRRIDLSRPFEDVIESGRTPLNEKGISEHPSVKPVDFMKKIVHASLPLGKGILVDPFMGSGSTISAAISLGYHSIGVERNPQYFSSAKRTIEELTR